MAIDPTDKIYVTYTINNRISIFSVPEALPISFSSEDGHIFTNNSNIVIERVFEGLDIPTVIAFLMADDLSYISSDIGHINASYILSGYS